MDKDARILNDDELMKITGGTEGAVGVNKLITDGRLGTTIYSEADCRSKKLGIIKAGVTLEGCSDSTCMGIDGNEYYKIPAFRQFQSGFVKKSEVFTTERKKRFKI